MFFNTLALSSIILLASFALGHKQGDCREFRHGKFELRSKFDNSIYLINRNDSIQTETNKNTGHVVRAKIKWTGECEYELLYFEETKNTPDTINLFLQKRPLKTKIIIVTKDYYVFNATMSETEQKLTDTLFVVK